MAPGRLSAAPGRREIHQLGPFRRSRPPILRQQPHPLFAVGALGVRARQGAFAKIVLLLRQQPLHAQIQGRDGTVGVLTNDDKTLLRPQHMHGLGAVGRDAVRRPRRHDALPQGGGQVAFHIDLERQLAAETDAEHPCGKPRQEPGTRRHEGEVSGAEFDVALQTLQQLAAIGPHQGQGGPALRHGGEVDPQLGPLGLQPALQPMQGGRRAARGGGQIKTLLPQPRHDAVVHDHAILAQHDPVGATPDLHAGHIVRVDALQEGDHIGAPRLDLAQGGGVHEGQGLAGGTALPGHSGVHIFALLWIEPGAQPLPHHFKFRPGFFMPAVQRGLAGRLVQRPHFRAGAGAKRDRRVGGPEGGGPYRGNGFVQTFRQRRHAVDVAQLALVGAKTQGCVAFDMLHAPKSLPRGLAHIR